nr:sigma-54-dependent Fis family transcriptional regulator [Patescibacteria group bacterium]
MEKPRILIVDDEESFLFSISKWFNDYDVSTFLSPSDALSSIMSGEQYDVILVDYRMPGMTGKDFLVKIKDYITSYKAILITAFSTSELLEQGLNDNLFQWVFNKPVDLKSLQLIIDNAFSILKNERQIKFLASSFINTKSICIYSCKSMEKTISLAGKYACSSANILIGGQSGTGKEIIAHYIHSMSSRSDKPFIKINCSTIPDHLFESELFGYCKGAFTGADSSKPGKFTLADGGTIFLDEIGEMPLQQQAKLLRVIED